jgi:hypothetical protein
MSTSSTSRARAYHPSGRSAAAFGPSHRLPTRLPRRVHCLWSRRCTESRPTATLPTSGHSVLYAVIFAVPAHRCPRLSPRRLTRRGSPRPCKVFLNRRVLPRLLRVPPRTSTGYVRGHFWPSLFLPPTPPYSSTTTSSPASLTRPRQFYFYNRQRLWPLFAALRLATALEPRQLVPQHGTKFILVLLYACSVLATPPRAFVPDASPSWQARIGASSSSVIRLKCISNF